MRLAANRESGTSRVGRGIRGDGVRDGARTVAGRAGGQRDPVALADADHAQPAVVVTVTLPVPPSLTKARLAGASAIEQTGVGSVRRSVTAAGAGHVHHAHNHHGVEDPAARIPHPISVPSCID